MSRCVNGPMAKHVKEGHALPQQCRAHTPCADLVWEGGSEGFGPFLEFAKIKKNHYNDL